MPQSLLALADIKVAATTPAEASKSILDAASLYTGNPKFDPPHLVEAVPLKLEHIRRAVEQAGARN